MRRRALLSLLPVAVIATAVACTSGPPPPDDGPYRATIDRLRADNNAFFKSKDSPLPADKVATFTALGYSSVKTCCVSSRKSRRSRWFSSVVKRRTMPVFGSTR